MSNNVILYRVLRELGELNDHYRRIGREAYDAKAKIESLIDTIERGIESSLREELEEPEEEQSIESDLTSWNMGD